MDPRDFDDLDHADVFATDAEGDDDGPRLLPLPPQPGLEGFDAFLDLDDLGPRKDDLGVDLDDLRAFEAAAGDPDDDDTPLDRYRAATERLRVLSDLARLGIWSDVAAEALPAMKGIIDMAVPSPR